MNNALSPFDSPLFLGLDDLQDMLCRAARSGDSFPPYNIEIVDDNTVLISLAVAGYKEQDLEVVLEDTELIIRGRQNQTTEHHYTHKGIAARSFIKTFFLADGMTVESVQLSYGLLTLTVLKPIKKTKRTVLKITNADITSQTIETKAKYK